MCEAEVRYWQEHYETIRARLQFSQHEQEQVTKPQLSASICSTKILRTRSRNLED